jgi:hypothetical protein
MADAMATWRWPAQPLKGDLVRNRRLDREPASVAAVSSSSSREPRFARRGAPR